MSKVRWLHISDLHYGYDSYVSIEMRSNMVKTLYECLPKDEKIDYLFVTGDLRYAKNSDNFPAQIVEDMKNLMGAFNIQPSNVHIVMGNHDVKRGNGREDTAPLLRKTNVTSKDKKTLERLETLEVSQRNFYEVYKSICERDPHPYHHVYSDSEVNIICLNTAIACSCDGEDGDLIVGMPLVQEALKDIDNKKPGIVLAHHGVESLQASDRERLEIKLKESGALLYLCGHEHLADCRNINARRENIPLFEYICGTGMDRLPSGSNTEMVIFNGELDTESRSGFVRGWEWRERSGAWLPCADISYKQTGYNDGYHYFPNKPIQKIIPMTLKEEAKRKYFIYILYECGEIRLDGMPADDKVGSKTLALEKLFIPLGFDTVGHGINDEHMIRMKDPFFRLGSSSNKDATILEINRILEEMGEGIWNEYSEKELSNLERELSFSFRYPGVSITQKESEELLARIQIVKEIIRKKNALIPEEGSGFVRVILAGPGGGKTTLLKRLATAYAFPERRIDADILDNLPDRTLYPIWIRCRDLKERAFLSINEVIQGIPHRAEYRPDCLDLSAAFTSDVFDKIQSGEALILIDGLDEISDKGARKSFAENIARFAQLYPIANIIVTSRVAGFELVSDGKLGHFPRAYISKLSRQDIKLLCRRWHKVIYADREDVIAQADLLADTILEHDKIYLLAESPLLLTTLLLVNRRVGRLPTKRIALYDECVKVLLETWNLEAFEPIELETAKCQLAFVAYEMMLTGTQSIGRQDLEKLIRKVRSEQSWLPTSLESPLAFLDRVELRSSLLTKRGFRKQDNGTLEEEYEFQHLTFQEYLSAFAIVNGYYEGADKQSNYLDALDLFYTDENREEVILLAAAQMNRKDVTYIVESIIRKLHNVDETKKNSNTVIPRLRNLLVKLVLDEAQVVEETRSRIFSEVTDNTIWFSQLDTFRKLLKTGFSEEFHRSLDESRMGFYEALNLEGQVTIQTLEHYINSALALKIGTEERQQKLKTLHYILWLYSKNLKAVVIRTSALTAYYEQVNKLADLLCKIEEGQEYLILTACIYELIENLIEGETILLPEGIGQRLIDLFFEKQNIHGCVRIFESFAKSKELALGQKYIACPDEIKKFLVSSFLTLDYSYKEGIFWAAVFAGTWDLSEAEGFIMKEFAEESEAYRKRILRLIKLNI